MPKSKGHRIFHVPEMLEAILLKLPTRELLMSKAVCKTWKRCINKSTKLKQALFLIPDGEVWSSLEALSDAAYEGKTTLRFNPLLRSHLLRLHEGKYTEDSRGKVILHDEVSGNDKVWRKMLVTQPPIKSFKTAIFWDNWAEVDEDVQNVTMKNSKGLTMGDVTKALEKELDRVGPEQFDQFDLTNFSVEMLAGDDDEEDEEEE